MTKPALEMTELAVEWLREIYAGLGEPCKRSPYDPLCVGCRKLRMINVLLRVEAGRRRAEFIVLHHGCDNTDPCHNWTPRDWLAEVEREVKGDK